MHSELYSKPIRSTQWKVRPGAGGRIGLAATVALLLLGGLGFVALLRTAPSLASLGLLLLGLGGVGGGLLAAGLTYGFYTLRYRLDRGALAICWLGQQEVIPYADIDAIYAGGRLGRTSGPKLLNVAGYRVGAGWSRGAGPVHFYTTSASDGEVSVIEARHGVFALTPVDPAAFRRTLIARIEASGGEQVAAARPRLWARLQVLGETAALSSVGLSLALLAVVLGFILNQYAGVPNLLPLHFDGAGQPGVPGPREQLFWLPAVGMALLLANTAVGGWLAESEPVLARLVWLASPIVQAMVFISVLRLLA
ncbi:MAG: hypothetical protein HY690_06630 [Chloroflexi bacterium]|nr:hypothetical protein [Chloroflexota bacterium]